jgi:glycogen debranching enzyme
VLGYRREAFTRETWIISSAKADIDEHGLSFAVHIEPHGEWTTSLEVVTVLVGFGENHEEATGGHGGPQARSEMKRSLEKLGEALPRLSCDWPSLQVTYRRSLVDLAALRFFPLTLPGQALPAAGLPWFMTLFGRDSMTVSYQALPFTSAFAETTLQALAQLQGTRVDDFRDEECTWT